VRYSEIRVDRTLVIQYKIHKKKFQKDLSEEDKVIQVTPVSRLKRPIFEKERAAAVTTYVMKTAVSKP
jgi:hypothetical protein